RRGVPHPPFCCFLEAYLKNITAQEIEVQAARDIEEHQGEDRGHHHHHLCLGRIGAGSHRGHRLRDEHGDSHDDRQHVVGVLCREVLDPSDEGGLPELDRRRQQLVKREQQRHLQQQRQTPAERVHVVLLVDGHDFLVHLGAPRVGLLVFLVLLLDLLDLGLDHLHLLHRKHLLQADREERERQQKRQEDDRDSVV